MNTLFDVYLFPFVLIILICAIIWLIFFKSKVAFIRIFSTCYIVGSVLLLIAFSVSNFFTAKCAMMSVGIPLAFLLSYIIAGCVSFYRTKPSMKEFFLPLAIFGAFTALFAELVILPGLESYYIFNPEIDTVYAPNFSKQKFSIIEIGMLKREVKSTLGEPISTYENKSKSIWFYSNDGGCDNCDAAWQQWTVSFENNQVNEKAISWACD